MQHECHSLNFLQGNMYLQHRTRQGATMGDRKPRTLNIKGPMMGHSISSDKHIRKGKLQGSWSLSQLGKLLKLMKSRKEAKRNK